MMTPARIRPCPPAPENLSSYLPDICHSPYRLRQKPICCVALRCSSLRRTKQYASLLTTRAPCIWGFSLCRILICLLGTLGAFNDLCILGGIIGFHFFVQNA